MTAAMAMRERAINSWQRLRRHHATGNADEVRTHPSHAQTEHGPVRFGLDHEDQLVVLVPVERGSRLPLIPGTSGLKVRTARYEVEGGLCQFIEIGCPSPALETAFAELADEIITRIEAGCSASKAVGSTLSDFRRLILSPVQPQVPEIVLTGALGELLVLELLAGIDSSAINAWTGPFDQRHDFRHGAHAIEVKATTRWGNRSVHISSLDQLLAPDSGSLLLAHVQLETTPDGPVSLAVLHDRLLASGVDAIQLSVGLAALGITDPYAETLSANTYSLRGIDWYQVGTDFPRLTHQELASGSLAAGISSVGYVLDLATAERHRLERSETTLRLKGFFECT